VILSSQKIVRFRGAADS